MVPLNAADSVSAMATAVPTRSTVGADDNDVGVPGGGP
jgi:hypothetical protein